MKRLLLITLTFLLIGCTKATGTLSSQLPELLKKTAAMPYGIPDNQKYLYSYYIEPSIGRVQSKETSNVFLKHGTQFVMNLNVFNIVNQEYYPEQNTIQQAMNNEQYLILKIEDTYTDYKQQSYPYVCYIYQVNNQFSAEFISPTTTFYCIGTEGQLLSIVPEMLKIARTIEVNKPEVLARYSFRELKKSEKEMLEYFDVAIPESGRVDEMISDKNHASSLVNENLEQTETPTDGLLTKTDDLQDRFK